MHRLLAMFRVLAFTLPVVACSGGSGGSDSGTGPGGGSDARPSSSNIVGSCTGGLETGCSQALCCQDYAGGFTSTTAQSSCAAIAGTYSPAPCTGENRVGSCILYQGTAAEQIVRYYAGYVFLDSVPGAESVAADCAALHIGTYVPEP
jgi:hypothetical protein